MVKKTILAIAVVAFLAGSVVQAADPVHYGGSVKDDDMWPYEYIFVDMCTMPIKIDVGYFVQIFECHERKILLKQVTCASIGQDDDKFPCYEDCDVISVRANFDVKLGGNVISSVSWFNKDNSSVYYKDCVGDLCVPDKIIGNGEWQETKVCVRAWAVEIWNAQDAQGQDEATLGTLTITVKPIQG